MFSNAPRVAVVRAVGSIAQGSGANRINLHKLQKPLMKAFKMRNVKAISLVVNSPGGSAVQSSLIKKFVEQLKVRHKVPVYAFVEDVAASGGYFVSCAADKIYADESSVVGSIGVVAGSFGFDKWIKRYDIERRTYSAGKKKVQLDPFMPEKAEDVENLQHIMKGIHANFREAVESSRGDRLRADADDLWEGQYWLAKEAMDLGLIDGIGSMHEVMAEEYGEDVKLVETGNPWELLSSGAWSAASSAVAADVEGVAARAMSGAMTAVEERGSVSSVLSGGR